MVVSPSAPPGPALMSVALLEAGRPRPSPGAPERSVYPALVTSPEDGPPPYSTLPYSASVSDANPWVAACPGLQSPRHHGGLAPAGVKLGYVDFVPCVSKKKLFSRDEYETFE